MQNNKIKCNLNPDTFLTNTLVNLFMNKVAICTRHVVYMLRQAFAIQAYLCIVLLPEIRWNGERWNGERWKWFIEFKTKNDT